MSRIGASVGGFQLRLLNQLNRIHRAIDQSNLRLATGKRINAASDDPAGIFSVNQLRAELQGVTQAASNVDVATSLVDTADTALAEVVTHLTTIRTKAQEAAGGTLSQAELEANQADIDAAIQAINDLARTSFGGKSLLDGSQDFVVSGRDPDQVRSVYVSRRKTQLASQTIDVDVSVAAEQAQLTYDGKGGSKVKEDATILLTGEKGSATISVTENEKLSDVRDRINLETANTGVAASVSGNDLLLTSAEFGSRASVVVEVTSGEFDVTGGNGDGTANGVDAEAVVNGSAVTADGLTLRYRSTSLDFDLQLQPDFGTGTIDTLTVSGKALAFQLGPAIGQPALLSLPSVRSAHLGGISGTLREVGTGGGKSLLDDQAGTAVQIADEALGAITVLQARVGAFSSQILGSAKNVLTGQEENLTAALGQVEDTDLALEAARLAKNQLLAENAAAALAIAANQDATVLTLLQRLI